MNVAYTPITGLTDLAATLKGPILVLGGGGFVGANLVQRLLRTRSDVVAVVRRLPAWRLADLDRRHLLEVDLTSAAELRQMVEAVRPRTVFDCAAYGAYSFETDTDLIYRTNFTGLVTLAGLLQPGNMADHDLAAFVHAGSSSEYGTNAAGPLETDPALPNSHYAVSKVAASQFIAYAGQTLRMPMVNLRLYSVYGPLEDTSRLMPNLVRHGLDGDYPPFVSPETSRDFVYVDDACEAFIRAAARMTPDIYGQSFNIGTGARTTMRDLAETARAVFGLAQPASFGTMIGRHWDVDAWFAAPDKASRLLGWTAATPLAEGLRRTADWVASLGPDGLAGLTKRDRPPERRSITAIVACYRDEPAVPVMYERLVTTFRKIGVDYEIIFVNDASPDDCAGMIRAISARDKRVIGITHSRNFGSQMAFRSGMEMATKDACVLLDGDLQDPPELIEQFFAEWQAGHDVVYGRRVKRDMPVLWGLLYKGFYRVFAAFSYIRIPHDAGDFSLMDKRVVGWLLTCPERDLFVRGLRAYVGFDQTGVDYVRPKRMFGSSTNNLFKNIGWAKRGLFSFSNTPLNMLTAGGLLLLGLSAVLGIAAVLIRLFAPGMVERGVTTILLAILFFGAINLFAIGLVGEYVAKIMEEVKGRPRLIRSALIKEGETTQLLPEARAR
jgi:nucleoside-diphosphate-sugar epimerase/glycosyltransferase involved in cell wall biosynthesis